MRALASAYFFSFSLRLLLAFVAIADFALLLLLPVEQFETLLLERFMIFIFLTFVLPLVVPFGPIPFEAVLGAEDRFIWLKFDDS